MHNPLVIEAIMLIAAIIVGVWSQRALPLHVDSRPILFLLCLFLGTGSALCLLLDILALLFTGQVATGGVRIYGPLLLLASDASRHMTGRTWLAVRHRPHARQDLPPAPGCHAPAMPCQSPEPRSRS